MKVQLVAVGNKMPQWVVQGYGEYAKRLPRELTPQLVEIPSAGRLKSARIEELKDDEGRAIAQAIAPRAKKIVLDVQGAAWSTDELAERLAGWQMDGDDLAFVIGGPDGLSQACLNSADARWSLSRLTLPHPLVRVVFIEQLYRAWTMLRNHPYHK